MAFWKKRRRTADGTIDGLIKVRGRNSRELADTKFVNYSPQPRRTWTPRAINREMIGGGGNTFIYTGENRGDFFRWMRDTIPIINAGVWTWVRLTATSINQVIEGSAVERDRAARTLLELDRRILEAPYGRGSGLTKLLEAYFLELFTTGRFAGEAVPAEDGKSIDHFRYIDPYRVEWEHGERGWTPFINNDEGQCEKLDPASFFYGTLGTDLTNPSGAEPLASIPFVVEVEQLMLEDMARSSHNAGTPRLQVKISRPEQFTYESDNDYAERANRYFQETGREFQHLEPDDNIFTWSDVDVTIIGQSGIGYSWRLGREQVIEDVITGLKLFPWVLGRTHKTTQNWVQSQFDLLMEMVQSHQKSGADLIDWLCNMELKLNGVQARVHHRFNEHSDPFRLERARAVGIELENTDLKVRRGYISKDQGAREMGYLKAFKQDDQNEKK